MTKFRLKMATQHGERIAKEFGYQDFPIDPRAIAREKNITVHAKPAEMQGVSGALIFVGDNVDLIYSTEHSNPGFENFCIAHELGHYFLDGHPEEIQSQGGTHVSRANFTENTSIELEADHFASGLLMPSDLVRKFLSQNQIGLEGIMRLADAAQCSYTAAAIRAAECAEYPIAVIMSQSDKIAYAFLSDGFKGLGRLEWLKKGTPIPDTSTRLFNTSFDNVLQRRSGCHETTLANWFGASEQVNLDEEILGLGNYGFTLTVLSSENLSLSADDDAEEEGDQDFKDRWTPRFAYGR